MTTRLRWGLLGTARIGRAVIPRLHELPRHEVVAVASRDPSRAQVYARQWEIPHAVGSYQGLLERDDLDVVYVALPNALHAEWTIRAADAGKHVLCEKPIALSMAGIDAILDAAARTGVCIAEAFMYRFHAQTVRVRQMLSAGDLGTLRLVRGSFSFRLERPGDIRWDPALGGGALWDVGCYPVSFARMAVGEEPVEVFALADRQPGGVDLGCAGLLQFGTHGMALFDCSFRATYRTSVELVGSDAVLHVPNPFKPGRREVLRLVRGDTEVRVDVDGEPGYQGEVEDMARQVLDGEPPALPLADSHGNTATLVALHRSAGERRPVALSEVV